jgi:hypothetical protein
MQMARRKDAAVIVPAPFTLDPAKVAPINDLLTQWMGVQGPVSSVYAAYLQRIGQFPSVHSALLGELKAPAAPEIPTAKAELKSNLAEPLPVTQAKSGTVPIYQGAPQVVTMAETYMPPVTVFRHEGIRAGIGVELPPDALQDAAVLAQHTGALLCRIGVAQNRLEHISDFAALACEEIKKTSPDMGHVIEGPVALFAIFNSAIGLKNALEAGDRFEMGHYVLDGGEHVVDLGGLAVDLFSHVAANTGSTTLHSLALGIRLGKLAYMCFDRRENKPATGSNRSDLTSGVGQGSR